MKKIFFILISMFFLCSCDMPKVETSRTGYRKVIQTDGTIFEVIFSSETSVNPVSWYEIEKDGNRHEFIHISRGITHWPDCKYCKTDKMQVDTNEY